MSAEGEAIRSNDYRKDTTVKAPSTRPAAVLGLDVGKSSHWACLIDRDGEVLASAPVRNRGARRHAAKGVRRLVERREALLARGVHNNKANVATARELACWVWAVGLMAEEA